MDNSEPIAVLIAVYNRPALLQKTLDSIVEYNNDTVVVVVDDGSRPAVSREELLYKGNLVVLRHAKNQGQVAALNTGLSYILAHDFRYIARLDAGDIALPGRFSKQSEFLRTHPKYGLVGSKIRSIGGSEIALHDISSIGLKKRLHVRSEFAHPAVMLTADAYRQTGEYDKRFAGMEDWDYWLRVAKRYELKNLPEVLTELDDTPGSISRDLKYRTRVKRRIMKAKVLWKYFDGRFVESYVGLLLALMITAINILVPPKVILARTKVMRLVGVRSDS